MWLMQWEVHVLRGVWLESIGMEIWTLKWCSLASVCAVSCHVKSNICAGVCVHNHGIALYSQECCLNLWRIILYFDRRGGLTWCDYELYPGLSQFYLLIASLSPLSSSPSAPSVRYWKITAMRKTPFDCASRTTRSLSVNVALTHLRRRSSPHHVG